MFAAGVMRVRRRGQTVQPAIRVEVDERASCAFGLVLGRSVEDLSKDFDRLEAKINGLLFGVATTLLVELWRNWP